MQSLKNPAYNIHLRVKRDEQQATYEGYVKKMQALGRTTEWHQGHSKHEVARVAKRTEGVTRAELEKTNRELKIIRRTKLQELYEAEGQMYETELNAKGLAILKDRE